jgi:hypothetical protein
MHTNVLPENLKRKAPRGTSKGKVVPVLFLLTEHHAMKGYWGVEVPLHTFLTSALDGGEWSASHPGRFAPREGFTGTHWIGGWVGPRAGLDAVGRRKIPSPCRHPDFSRGTSRVPSRKQGVRLLTGFSWLRTGTTGGPL